MTDNSGHHKILIIRFSSIGDIVLTVPLVSAVREKYPDAKIDYLTLSVYSALLKSNPCINRLYTVDRERGFFGLARTALSLRKNGYTHVLDLHRSTRSLVFRALLCGKKSALNKRYLKRFLLIKFKINLYKKPLSVVNRYFDTARTLKVRSGGEPAVWAAEEELNRFVEIINNIIDFDICLKKIDGETIKLERNIFRKKGGRIICLMPFAKWKTKEWGDEKFIELGRCISEMGVAALLILGGNDDRERAEKIAAAIGSNAVSCAGKFSLIETSAALAVSDALVTNDTGVMHLGGAVSIPVIALFGSTAEELGFFPFNAQGEVLQIAVSCRPCTAKGLPGCPEKHFACMNKISVKEVYNAVRRYL